MCLINIGLGPALYSLPQEIAHVASQIAWKYSRCTGRRKALCVSCTFHYPSHTLTFLFSQIGINYLGSSHELKGCINDAIAVQRFLTSRPFPLPFSEAPLLTSGQQTIGIGKKTSLCCVITRRTRGSTRQGRTCSTR